MSTIENYDKYNSGMKKSIKDKLFFEGLVGDIETVVDFGCADGQILTQIHKDFPEWRLIGVDNDKEMVKRAIKNCPSAMYFRSLSSVPKLENTLLNLSSVIHEVYSYCNGEEIFNFWFNVFNSGYKYISIRDLMISNSAKRTADTHNWLKVIKKWNVDSEDFSRLEEFNSVWGGLVSNENLIHYLLKYRYIENWDRELHENYFPIILEDLLNMIPSTYEIVYFNHYILPFTKEVVRNDFGIELEDNTHVKILLKRKGE